MHSFVIFKGLSVFRLLKSCGCGKRLFYGCGYMLLLLLLLLLFVIGTPNAASEGGVEYYLRATVF